MHRSTTSRTLPLSLALAFIPGCVSGGGLEDDATSGSSSGGGEPAIDTTEAGTWPPTRTTTDGDDTMDTTGASGSGECEPGAQEACAYGGPDGTEGVGACRPASRVCGQDGLWEECSGEVVPTTEDCGTKVDENCDGEVDCTGAIEWARGFGEKAGGEPGSCGLRDVAIDGTGAVWITGNYRRSLQFADAIWETANNAYFIARVDGRGDAGFSFGDQQLGAVGTGFDLTADGAGKLAVSAVTQGKLQIAAQAPMYETGPDSPVSVVGALGEAGDYRWSHPMTSDSLLGVMIRTMAFDGAGNLWSAGDFGPSNAFIETGLGPIVLENQGQRDGLLVKTRVDGHVAWALGFGDGRDQSIQGVAVDGWGDVWIVGEFAGTMQFDGGSLHANVETEVPDMFVVKLDATGKWKWGRGFGGAGTQRLLGVDLDSDGSGVVIGEYTGESLSLGAKQLVNDEASSAMVVAKIDADGETQWARSWPCDNHCGVRGLAVDGAGQAVVAAYVADGKLSIEGQSFQIGVGADMSVLAKLDRDGNAVWPARSYPATAAVAVGASGEIYLAGTYAGAVSFGADSGQQLDAGAGDEDIYVAKLLP